LVKNVAVATAFGLGVDIIATIPSNANAGLVANDDDRSFASSYTSPSLKITNCILEFRRTSDISVVLYEDF
jgi:hypothetical protein